MTDYIKKADAYRIAVHGTDPDVAYKIQQLQPDRIVRINLNEKIKVKLTDYGKDIYFHRFDYVNKMARQTVIKPRFPDVDSDGYTSFQLWDFINIYGGHFVLGSSQNVICPLEIVYTDDEDLLMKELTGAEKCDKVEVEE